MFFLEEYFAHFELIFVTYFKCAWIARIHTELFRVYPCIVSFWLNSERTKLFFNAELASEYTN